MASKWKITERIPLTTKATDQAGRSYDVELQMDGTGHWTVKLMNTPGSWRFETIKDAPANLAISGLSWFWTNTAPVIDEAEAILNARKKSGAQLDREIAEVLARRKDT